MKRIFFIATIALVAAISIPSHEAQAQCAACSITQNFMEDGLKCQHGPLQNPEADDCHMNDKGGCVLVGIPCGGGPLYTTLTGSEFLPTLDGSPTGLTDNGRDTGDGRMVYENCLGLLLFVEYSAKAEDDVRFSTEHIVV